MPLQHLAEYFNDRFEREHNLGFRPFLISGNKVSGLFGPIRIHSQFSPIRQMPSPTSIAGHAARIEVATGATQPLHETEIESLLANRPAEDTPVSRLDSFIHFDRLARTVHMLNYLPLLSPGNKLFLEVDPRHILGVKRDHGVYFGEIISQCGLENNHVVIVLSIYGLYSKYYPQLLAGLDNYRQQDYRIALRFANQHPETQSLNLITQLSPDYVGLSAKFFDFGNQEKLKADLEQMTSIVAAIQGQSILHDIDQKQIDELAKSARFDFVEGSYYNSIAYDYLSRVQDNPASHAWDLAK